MQPAWPPDQMKGPLEALEGLLSDILADTHLPMESCGQKRL